MAWATGGMTGARSLRTRLLISVGLLATCTALAIALAVRRDTRREFLRYQDVERRASAADLPARGPAIAARLDGRCCDAAVLVEVQATLPRTARVVVVDRPGSRLLAASTLRTDGLTIVAARTRGDVLTIDAERATGQGREQFVLQLVSRGTPIGLADGTDGRLHLVPVPDPARAERADAFLGTFDRRLLWLTGAVSVVALGLTWLVARSTARPLAVLRTAAADLGAGHFDRRVPLDGPSEVRALAETFNRLAARLEEQHALRRALTNDVAHELRTPLTALQCRLESVIDGVAADPAGACRALHADLRHLTRLVDDLQDVALAEARELRLAREPVSLEAVTADAVRLAGLDGDPRLRVAIAHDVRVLADPSRLRQVLTNLLANAAQQSPGDASIEVRAGAKGGRVCVQVENTGTQVPDESLPHLFDRFYRADPARQRATGGTGLGLAIVKHLVEAQDGTVHARNGAGSVVMTLDLPQAEANGAGSGGSPSRP